MDIVLLITGIVIAAGAGFFVGRNHSQNAKEHARLQHELNEKTQELETFRNKVTGHFEKTADLFNQVSDSYQSLYDHMAKSSSQLCSSPTFQSLPKSEAEKLTEKPATVTQDSDKTSEEVFDADRLYKAHDYRNSDEEKIEEVVEEIIDETDKIIDLETAKEDRSEPALDYAVKADGVINHNSLDNDNVKSS